MRERPILFSAPMVRAILDGTKTQTRRIASGLRATARSTIREDAPVGSGRMEAVPGRAYHAQIAGGGAISVETSAGWLGVKPGEFDLVCPYANGRTYLDRNPDRWRVDVAAGSRLWVREEHFRFGHWEPVSGAKTRKGGRQKWMFVADSNETRFTAPDGVEVRRGRHHRDPATPAWHKRLARFMPRCLSRITLEVTSVHVERLQEITEADAAAEGCTSRTYRDGRGHEPAALDFRRLWESINGPESWDANPWVWVMSFRKLEVAGG